MTDREIIDRLRQILATPCVKSQQALLHSLKADGGDLRVTEILGEQSAALLRSERQTKTPPR